MIKPTTQEVIANMRKIHERNRAEVKATLANCQTETKVITTLLR
jgi:hypothetical protein